MDSERKTEKGKERKRERKVEREREKAKRVKNSREQRWRRESVLERPKVAISREG